MTRVNGIKVDSFRFENFRFDKQDVDKSICNTLTCILENLTKILSSKLFFKP